VLPFANLIPAPEEFFSGGLAGKRPGSRRRRPAKAAAHADAADDQEVELLAAVRDTTRIATFGDYNCDGIFAPEKYGPVSI